ncbi:hypothetical protein BDR06DRAFT_1015584 [Suillus hirtellus]|nr:hypothetical protein BDR06DRAFT_1015584 [Suillus hirtellus]
MACLQSLCRSVALPSHDFRRLADFSPSHAHSQLDDEEPHFKNTILRVLRIVHRVLDIQDIFFDILVPLFTECDGSQIVGVVHTRSYYTRFDQALSYGTQHIPAIAACKGQLTPPQVYNNGRRIRGPDCEHEKGKIAQLAERLVPLRSGAPLISAGERNGLAEEKFWQLATDSLPPQEAEILLEDLGMEFDTTKHKTLEKGPLCAIQATNARSNLKRKREYQFSGFIHKHVT